MFQGAGNVERAGKHDEREIGDQGCPRNSNNAITAGEVDLGGEARYSEDGGHDDLKAHDAGATEKHRDGGSATFHDRPEGEAEKQNERRRDARADPPGEKATSDEQHRYRRDRGEAESQDKRTFESPADPRDIATRDGFSIGRPERRGQHGDHQGNQREHALRDGVIGNARGSQGAGDDNVVGGKRDGRHQLEDKEQGSESDDARDGVTRDETTAGAQIWPAHDEKVKRVEGSGRNWSSGKGGDEKWQRGVHADSGDDAGQPGETAAYLPEIHAKALLQSQLGALYEVEGNVEREAAGEDHERRSRLGASLSRGDAKDVGPGDPGEGGSEKPQQQKPNRAEDGETAGDGSADAVEVVLTEGIGHSVEYSVADAEIGEVGHGKHGADSHPEAESLIAEVMNGERNGDERG